MRRFGLHNQLGFIVSGRTTFAANGSQCKEEYKEAIFLEYSWYVSIASRTETVASSMTSIDDLLYYIRGRPTSQERDWDLPQVLCAVADLPEEQYHFPTKFPLLVGHTFDCTIFAGNECPAPDC